MLLSAVRLLGLILLILAAAVLLLPLAILLFFLFAHRLPAPRRLFRRRPRGRASAEKPAPPEPGGEIMDARWREIDPGEGDEQP